VVAAVIKLVAHGGLLNTMPITEEILVEFLLEHNIECAEDLDDLSHLILLIRAEANAPCAVMWDEDVTVH
jgi:hypothetical protein